MNNQNENSPDSTTFHWLEHRDRSNLTHFRRFPSRRERRREQALKDWFGTELGRNEIQARQQPSAPLEKTLDGLMKELGKGRQVLLEQIKDRWPELAGADIARQTSPLKLYHQCLDIEVSNSMWLYELQTRRKNLLLQRLKEFSNNQIQDIRLLPAGRRR